MLTETARAPAQTRQVLKRSEALKETLKNFPNADGSTILNLLASDGAISVVFPAFLTEEQYSKLFESIREHLDSRYELQEQIAIIANEWGMDASFEDISSRELGDECELP